MNPSEGKPGHIIKRCIYATFVTRLDGGDEWRLCRQHCANWTAYNFFHHLERILCEALLYILLAVILVKVFIESFFAMECDVIGSSSEITSSSNEDINYQVELKKKEDALKTLKTDVLGLEETVKEQADMIEDLKNQLVSKVPMGESALLSASRRISEQETRVLHFTIQQLRTTGGALCLRQDLKNQLVSKVPMGESALLSASRRISEQETRVLHFTIQQLRDELSEARQDAASTRAILETQKALCLNQEKEIAKRREQLDESLEMVEQMREELKDANRRANGADWKAKERLLRMQMEEERVESERKLTTLEAKLKMMRQREDAMLEGLEEVRAALEESQRCHEEHMKECARASAEISAKDAELISLRARLELLTPLRDVQRTNSMDDMLMSQVKSLTAQINEMKTLRDGDERLSDLENRIGALTATNGFLEKQLKEANDREERLKEEVEKWKGEVSELKAEIKRSEERLLECEGSAELTNRYLVDENSKIKQQKAEIRCELIALKREHARLLDAKQRAPDEAELTALREEVTTLKEKLRVAETTQKEENRIKSEPMGTTEIASLLEELATLREKIRVAELQEMQLRTLKAMKGDQCALNKGDNASTQAPRKEYAVKEEGCTECERLKEELVSLKQSQNMESMSALKEKYEQMEKELTEKYNMQKAIAEKLQKELLEAREKNDELRNATRVLDEQCDKLMELKKRAEAGRKKAVERLTSTNEKLSELRRERDSHQQTDADYKRLLQENERLTKKIDYLSVSSFRLSVASSFI
uniref:Myosin tail domain-containing protein n=1 Tax=Ascaris lumbricoides TaxID=6252 RepID=A0A9J2PLN7_ASCLU